MTSICAKINFYTHLQVVKHFSIKDLQQWLFKSISLITQFYLKCSSESSMSFYVDPMTGRVISARDLHPK